MALILVTGSSTGLGLACATALAGRGHAVVLHARNAERLPARAVLDRMHDVLLGDLSGIDETIRVAEDADAIGEFDAVIHNAGMLRGPEVLPVNVLAPYVLTALITPRRSIYLSSSMHFTGSSDLSVDPLARSPLASGYDDSKLYVTTLAMALAAQRPDLMSHAVDPGWVPTRMGGAAAPDSLTAGHETQEWLATADAGEVTPRSGGYWYHRMAHNPHPAAMDPQFQTELIEVLEGSTGIAWSWRP